MQIQSAMGAAYVAAAASPQAKVSPEVNAAAVDAAAQANAAMANLADAVSGASEAIMNLAAGTMSNACDIQV